MTDMDPKGPEITDAELEAIEKRADAATPGPWVAGDYDWSTHDVVVESEMRHLARVYHGPGEANTRFIAHARTDVPRLIAALRARDARVATLGAQIADCHRALAYLDDLRNARVQAIARAEAAEKRVAGLEANRSEATQTFAADLVRVSARAERAEARVAELEASLEKNIAARQESCLAFQATVDAERAAKDRAEAACAQMRAALASVRIRYHRAGCEQTWEHHRDCECGKCSEPRACTCGVGANHEVIDAALATDVGKRLAAQARRMETALRDLQDAEHLDLSRKEMGQIAQAALKEDDAQGKGE